MNQLGDAFLARSGLTDNQHGRIARPHAFDQAEQAAKFFTLAHE